MLGKLEIDKALLPRLYESTDVTGTLTASAAKELGLAVGTPVIGGGSDGSRDGELRRSVLATEDLRVVPGETFRRTQSLGQRFLCGEARRKARRGATRSWTSSQARKP